MAPRVCAQPGCPQLIPTDKRRCTEHARQVEAARGTKTQRGYGADHQRLRRWWQHEIDSGREITCPRCGETIPPGAAWDLGHSDDRTSWTGPEHATCNRSAGGRAAHP